MTLDVLPAEIRAIIHDLATSAERIEGRPAGRELVVDLNAAAQGIADAVAVAAELIATALEALDGDDNWGTMISQNRAVEIAREIGGVS